MIAVTDSAIAATLAIFKLCNWNDEP